MEKLELDYHIIAEDINCDGIEDIRERLNYLIGELESAKQYLPYRGGGSEMEYAIGDTCNLLNTIYFNINLKINK